LFYWLIKSTWHSSIFLIIIQRFHSIGIVMYQQFILLQVNEIKKGKEIIRIISARPANAKEKKYYENY